MQRTIMMRSGCQATWTNENNNNNNRVFLLRHIKCKQCLLSPGPHDELCIVPRVTAASSRLRRQQ
jgi:hypothetical protein